MDSQPPRLTILGRLFVIAIIGVCAYGAWYFFAGRSRPSGSSPSSADGGGPATSADASGATTIGIAYGTEKQRWLEWAVEQFGQAREGRHIRVQLIPMGSLEGAQAILNGDKRINVWSPASVLYKASFVSD